MDRRRLLIPGIAVGEIAGQDPLADVGVQALVRAHRFDQRGQTHEAQDARERQEQAIAHAGAGGKPDRWIIVLASRSLPVAAAPAALSIVVPTYNERDRLSDLVTAIFGTYEDARLDAELVIVDDNSPDGTGALADELAARHRMTVLHRAGKLGLGTAVIEGFAAASAPIVGVIDADLSHPPALVPKMLAAMAGAKADVVVASRHPGGGRATGRSGGW